MPSGHSSTRAVRAALAAACAMLGASGLHAADLDYRGDTRQRLGEAYDDPRYADIYRTPPSRYDVGPDRDGERYRYVDRYGDRDEQQRYREEEEDILAEEPEADARFEERYEDGPDVEEERSADGGRYEPERCGSGPERRGYSYKDDLAEERCAPPPRYSDALREPAYRERYDERHAGRGPACVPRRVIRRALHEEGWLDLHALELAGPVARLRARRDSGRLFALELDRCTGRVLHAEVLSPSRTHVWTRGPRRHYPTY